MAEGTPCAVPPRHAHEKGHGNGHAGENSRRSGEGWFRRAEAFLLLLLLIIILLYFCRGIHAEAASGRMFRERDAETPGRPFPGRGERHRAGPSGAFRSERSGPPCGASYASGKAHADVISGPPCGASATRLNRGDMPFPGREKGGPVSGRGQACLSPGHRECGSCRSSCGTGRG